MTALNHLRQRLFFIVSVLSIRAVFNFRNRENLCCDYELRIIGSKESRCPTDGSERLQGSRCPRARRHQPCPPRESHRPAGAVHFSSSDESKSGRPEQSWASAAR